MNATSESRAKVPAGPCLVSATVPRALIWDAPVRVFHWLMVLSFAGAYLTAESERWRLVHVTLGYTMAGLLAFRIVWGLVGTRHARFSSFVRGPAAVLRYLRGMVSGHPEHYAGHNPLGAVAIVTILGLTGIVTASGWAIYSDLGAKWPEQLHEGAANAMLVVVGVHIVGVLIGSWMHHDNLIGAMVTGRKAARSQDAVHRAWRSVALCMLAVVFIFWLIQWQSAPVAVAPGGTPASVQKQDHDKD